MVSNSYLNLALSRSICTALADLLRCRGMDTLRGVIERITYHNEENGYTVAKLLPERGQRVDAVRPLWRRP